ncbi:MAG: hypothetical protein IJ433_02110 [Ruminococcus sp.]|nr:hypothetical protein [Ruminococcus sp.]
MSSILSKMCKVSTAIALVLCICMSFAGCVSKTDNIKDVDQICVSGSYTESWMYVFTDKGFIDEMVTVYNDLQYEETDENVDMMTAGEIYSFTFSKGNDTLARFIVDSNNVMTFEAGTQCYKIVSDFDFEHIKSLVEEQTLAVSGADATSDEV